MVGALVAVSSSIGAAASARAETVDGCTRVADQAPGAVEGLVDALAPGEVGCLRGGTYYEDVTVRRGGVAGSPVTLRSYPGERARIVGGFKVADSADFVTVRDLDLDGRGSPEDTSCTTTGGCGLLPSPQVYGDDVKFVGNDVTNGHKGICFSLGYLSARAYRTVIDGNRIHDCGRLPATGHDHGVYVSRATDTRVTNNWIYDNADYGIHLYPDAQDTMVSGNVIDGNGMGVLFAGNGSNASSGNVVTRNVISNSVVRWNVASWWGGPVGVGNEVAGDCHYASNDDPYFNSDGGVASPRGFWPHNNVVADPQFVDRAGHNYRLSATSPCNAVFTGQPPKTG